MKKIRQILALLGVVLLICLYAISLFCAVTDSSGGMVWFKASLITTFIIPVLLWTYSFVYRMVRGNQENDFLQTPDEPEEAEATAETAGTPETAVSDETKVTAKTEVTPETTVSDETEGTGTRGSETESTEPYRSEVPKKKSRKKHR